MTSTLALEFLAPWAGMIGAAISLPALLILYFLKLRRRPMRVSSTLLWEQSVADLQVNAPFRMIKPSWILLLQLLALACLLVALARPSIDRPALGSRVILVLDASASMSARDTLPIDAQPGEGNITRFERARREAQRIVSRLPDRTEVMVVALAARAQVMTPFTRNRQQARQALGAISATDQPASLDDALRMISAFARGSSGEEGDAAPDPPRVILLSDGSFPPPSADEGRPPMGNAQLEYMRIGPATAGENVGIVSVAARRDYEDPTLCRIFVRLQSTRAKRASIGVSLLLDGVAADAASINLPAAGDGTASEATHRFEVRNQDGGVVTIQLAVDDVLKADDRASVLLDAPSGPRIALVRAEGPLTIGAAALQTALETLGPARLDVLSTGQAELRGLLGQEASAFAGYDLLVLDRVKPVALPPVASMSFGATIPIPGLSVIADPDAAPTPIAFWMRSHPIMRYVTLSDVVVDRPMRLTIPDPTDTADVPTTIRELASGIDAPLLVLLERAGVRRIVAALALDDTNWWRDLSFPTFIANAVAFLAPSAGGIEGRAWRTADAPLLSWPGAAPDAQAMLLGPDGWALPLRAGEDGRAAPGPLPRAGLYEIRAQDAAAIVPVNLLDPLESAASVLDQVDIGSQIASATEAAALAPREIWWWFILAALALTTLEWLVFARRMRV